MDGNLQEGDQILKINDDDFRTTTLAHAAALLRVRRVRPNNA